MWCRGAHSKHIDVSMNNESIRVYPAACKIHLHYSPVPSGITSPEYCLMFETSYQSLEPKTSSVRNAKHKTISKTTPLRKTSLVFCGIITTYLHSHHLYRFSFPIHYSRVWSTATSLDPPQKFLGPAQFATVWCCSLYDFAAVSILASTQILRSISM